MRKYIIAFFVSLFLFLGNVNALTKAPVDVTKMDVNDLLEALDKGYLTSEKLVNIYLERIDAYDSQFNSINQINEHAVEQAKELDKERENGKLRGKLHGIPILVKCNIDVYGIPTTGGTKSLLDNYPNENSFVVERLIDEGAIILGSTNMSELAFSAAYSYSSFGYVRNVFNRDYTPYGSSGGSAVAAKAFFAAAALGTDTNSSVRLPASGAGLVGMRPTLGLVSRTGVIPYDIERDTVGILTHSVSDNALLLSIISGEDYNDKITTDVASFEMGILDGDLNGIRIGVAMQYVKGSSKESGITGLTDDDIYMLVEDSIEKLKNAGATIVYLDDFVKSSNISIARSTYAGATMCDYFDQYILGTTGNIRSFKELVNSSGHVQSLGGYVKSCGKSNNLKNNRDSKKLVYRNYVSDYFDENDLDVILYPTVKNKVYNYKSGKNISPGSSLGSVIGYPSITVPMGMIDEFSYGIEFLSRAYSENVLYKVAIGFEKSNGNVVSTSILTPSLYVFSDKVEELKSLYEKELISLNKSSLVDEWLKDTKNFFKEYNDIEDVDSNAGVLIERYNRIISKKDYFGNDYVIWDIFEVFVILISILVCLIIFKEVLRCFK
jgi:Asp-tRNA(Asn)/Glu-tRNA(Gln) amidotransferase A subunit family amidase